MDLKYIYQIATLLLLATIYSSCLKSNQNIDEGTLSKNAQIYTISMSSSKDTPKALANTKFTIDQLENSIYNAPPLPYLFDIDSVYLNISGAGGYQFGKVVLYLKNTDSSYVWNKKDSVSLKRLAAIETTAPDGATTKKYNFTANIYQEDPYVLTWTKIAENHLPASA